MCIVLFVVHIVILYPEAGLIRLSLMGGLIWSGIGFNGLEQNQNLKHFAHHQFYLCVCVCVRARERESAGQIGRGSGCYDRESGALLPSQREKESAFVTRREWVRKQTTDTERKAVISISINYNCSKKKKSKLRFYAGFRAFPSYI